MKKLTSLVLLAGMLFLLGTPLLSAEEDWGAGTEEMATPTPTPVPKKGNSWVGIGGLRRADQVIFIPEAAGACRFDISCDRIENCNPLARLWAIRIAKMMGRDVLLVVTFDYPPTPEQTRTFFKTILTHYPLIEMVEVGNEPDMFWKGTPEEYIGFLSGAYKVIKKSSPNTQVLMAAVSGIDKNDKAAKYFLRLLDLLSDLKRKGKRTPCDAFAVHEYEDPESLFYRILHFRKATQDRGIAKPLIVTEWGCSQPKEEDKAKCLVKGLNLAKEAGAKRVFVYELPGSSPFGLLDGNGKPTEAFRTIQRWAIESQ